MARKQVLIALGMLAAALVCAAVAAAVLGGPPAPPSGPLGPGDRLALAARWMLAPGLCLLAGIASTAGSRFFSPDAVDGAAPAADRTFEINQRYNRNTLEQSVLAAIAWSGLALALPAGRLDLIPALAGLFVVGRAAFWIGYLFAPWARAFGFGLTFYPTAGAYVWLTAAALA